MKRMLSLEWQTIKAKNTLIKALGYLLFYYVLFYFLVGRQKMGMGFFPTMATISSITIFISLFEEGKEMPMRRLLPSLPFSRREIFLGRTLIKLIIWAGGVGVAFLFSWLMDPIMDSWPTSTTILVGLGFSLFALSLEHWSLQLSAGVGNALKGALVGGTMGLLIGSGGVIFKEMFKLDPQGIYFGIGGILLALVSLWLNQMVYQRRAL